MKRGNIFFKNRFSATIEQPNDGTFELVYPSQSSQSISWTLPVSEQTYHSDELFPFLDGLIPEGWLLDLAQRNWKIASDDRMSLLLAACQDCIGAAHVISSEDHLTDTFATRKSYISSPMEGHAFSSEQCLVCMDRLESAESLYHAGCAKKLFGYVEGPVVDVSSSDMEQLALSQLNRRLTLAGVQKKLSLSPMRVHGHNRLTVVGVDGSFILKPSSDRFPEMAELEHLCMKLAENLHMNMAACGLVYLKSGERAYLTRRFDRQKGQKIQVEDFCQLSGKSTQKKYTGSAEGMGKVIDSFSSTPQDDKLTLFQMILFSFWIGNADMHLKNFSLWQDPKSKLVRMSPGYDFLSTRLLIPSAEDNEELALPVNGKKNKLKWDDFLALGENLKIPRKVQERVREDMLDSFFEAEALIEMSFLSDQKKEEFRNLLASRSKRLS